MNTSALVGGLIAVSVVMVLFWFWFSMVRGYAGLEHVHVVRARIIGTGWAIVAIALVMGNLMLKS